MKLCIKDFIFVKKCCDLERVLYLSNLFSKI